MTSVDKAAIGWTIAIVVFGVSIALFGVNQAPVPSTPPMMDEMMDDTMMDDTMDDTMMDDTMDEMMDEMMDEPMMDDTMMDETMNDTMMDDTMDEMMDETMDEMMDEMGDAGAKTVTVTITTQASILGCEEENTCYEPNPAMANVGDTVSWQNVDLAIHTITGGTPTSGPDGIFDSGLLSSGGSFETIFDSPGTYSYFCQVHPWTVGEVIVS